jgi:hypothetical protein
MLRIKALETREPGEELAILSPFVSKIGKGMPYDVPAGYFDGLEKKLLQSALNKEQTAEEELETLSPLLSGLKKQTPYSVPAGYFEQLNHIPAEQKTGAPAKVISMTSRKWFRYAAAAVVIGVIALGAFLFTGKNNIDPNDQSYAWIKKNMKKVSTDEMEEFIDIATQETPVIASSNVTEVKELVKNIPDEEIQEFLKDVDLAEPDSDDIILN